MTMASHVYKRLCKLYGAVLNHCRQLEFLMERGIRSLGRPEPVAAVLEQYEPRLLMSGATVGITANNHLVAEGDTNPAVLVVSRDDTAGDLTVNYSTSGTADSTDYSVLPSTAGSLVIPDGQSSATISIAPLSDGLVEGPESLLVTLAAGTGYDIDSSAASDSITIADSTVPSVADSASFVGWNVPSEMTAGQTYTVTVSMRNTGSATWTAGGDWLLGSQLPDDNYIWGLARVQPSTDVATGEVADFTFDVVAPSAAGSYAFSWKMVHEYVRWFGDNPGTTITVTGSPVLPAAPSDLAATAVSAGQINLTWTDNSTNETGFAIDRSTSADFSHDVTTLTTTPNTTSFGDTGLAAGTTYYYRVRATNAAGASDNSDAASAVTASTTADAAVFVGWDIPSEMVAGQTYTVTVTMRNTGSATWTAGGDWLLGSQEPQDNYNWGMARVQPAAEVATGQEATFTFDVTAPWTTGEQTFNWKMVHEYVQWFGDNPGTTVSVVSGASVTTNLQEYGPGQTAYITSSGFKPGEMVEFHVVRTDGIPDGPPGNVPWQVTDGSEEDMDGIANGQITTSWFVYDDYVNSTLEVNATGLDTGLVATASFEDDVYGLFQTRAAGDWASDTTWVEGMHGTISFIRDSYTVTGTGTDFSNDFPGSLGDYGRLVLWNGTDLGKITAINGNQLTLDTKLPSTETNCYYGREVAPTSSNTSITVAHQVTVSDERTVSGVTVSAGGSSSGSIIVAAGGDLTFTGSVYTGGITINAGGSMTVGSSMSTLPPITINGTSTASGTLSIPAGTSLNINAFTSYLTVGSYGVLNLEGVMACSGNALFVTGTAHISGSIGGTGVALFQVNSTGNVDMTGTATVAVGPGGGQPTLTVAGTMSMSGSSSVSVATTSYSYVTITGTLTMSGSTEINSPTGYSHNMTQVMNGGRLELGPDAKIKGAAFSLAGGILTIGASEGISATGAYGNIRSANVLPFPSASNYVYNGTSGQFTGDGLPTSVTNLTINNSSSDGVKLTRSTTVTGSFIPKNGRLVTVYDANNYALIVTGTVSRQTNDTGYVDGNLTKSFSNPSALTRTFEVGTASGYDPVTVAFGSTGFTAGSLTVRAKSGDHPNLASVPLDSAHYVKTYWTLAKPTGSNLAGTYSGTFGFVDSTAQLASGTVTGLLRVAQNTGSWATPAVGTQTVTSTQATGLTTFGDFVVADVKPAGTWQLDGNVNDSSGSSNNGTANGSFSYQTNTGRPGSVPNFDGINDYVTMGDVLSPGSGSYTVSLWFRRSSIAAGTQFLASKGNAVTDAVGWSMGVNTDVNGDGHVFVGLSNGDANSQKTLTDSEGCDDTLWHHLALVIDKEAGALSAYLDGTSLGSASDISSWNINNADALLLGAAGSPIGGFFNGLLDDAVIYQQALSQSEVAALAGSTPTIKAINTQPGHDYGQERDAIAMSATVVGGKGTLTYAWLATNGRDSQTGSGPTWNLTPDGSGTYTVTLTVTDAYNVSATTTRTLLVTPVAPSNLTATVKPGNIVELHWQANSSDPTRFVVTAVPVLGTTVQQSSLVEGDTAMQMTGLQPDTDYNFSICGFTDPAYPGASSASVSVETAPGIAPAEELTVDALPIAGFFNLGGVSLSWQNPWPTVPSGAQIIPEYRTESSRDFSALSGGALNTTADGFTCWCNPYDSGLSPGTEYLFRIRIIYQGYTSCSEEKLKTIPMEPLPGVSISTNETTDGYYTWTQVNVSPDVSGSAGTPATLLFRSDDLPFPEEWKSADMMLRYNQEPWDFPYGDVVSVGYPYVFPSSYDFALAAMFLDGATLNFGMTPIGAGVSESVVANVSNLRAERDVSGNTTIYWTYEGDSRNFYVHGAPYGAAISSSGSNHWVTYSESQSALLDFVSVKREVEVSPYDFRWSGVSGFIDLCYPTPPGSPSYSVTQDHRVNIAWADNAYNEDGYKVEIAKALPGGRYSDWEEVTTTDADVASCVTKQKDPGKYMIRVAAIRTLPGITGDNADVQSEWTTPITVTVPGQKTKSCLECAGGPKASEAGYLAGAFSDAGIERGWSYGQMHFGTNTRMSVDDSSAFILQNDAVYAYSVGGGSDDTGTLTYDTAKKEYTWTHLDGTKYVFNASGQLTDLYDTSGNRTQYSYNAVTFDLTTITQDIGDAITYTRFAYDTPHRVSQASVSYLPSGGTETISRNVVYTYSGEDLQMVQIKDGNDAPLGVKFYAYYNDYGLNAFPHAIQAEFDEAACARIMQVTGKTAAQLADVIYAYMDYATRRYEYDHDGRVTRMVTAGTGAWASGGDSGQGSTTFTYSKNSLTIPSTDYAAWKYLTVQTLMGSGTVSSQATVVTTYSNYAGQPILKVTQDPSGNRWAEYYEYDSAGRQTLHANPSAVATLPGSLDAAFDETTGVFLADEYLKAHSGLIETTHYTNRMADETRLQEGMDDPTPKLQSTTTYSTHTINGVTAYLVGSTTEYVNDDGTGARTTTYTYTWDSDKLRQEDVTTSGTSSSVTTSTVYDDYGRAVWTRDADGFLTYTEYDDATGAVKKTIQDVHTNGGTGFVSTYLPSAWATSSGAHLTTTYEIDGLGRVKTQTAPNGVVTYTFYNDADHQVRTYTPAIGLNGGIWLVQISRDDLANGYSESLEVTISRTTGVAPTGNETIANVTSWSRSFTNPGGQTIETRQYFQLPYGGYSSGVNPGKAGVDYLCTTYTYDNHGRLSETTGPDGTTSRTEYDDLGRVESTWSVMAGSPVQLSENVYDHGTAGDSLLTESRTYHDASNYYATDYNYDWRDRQTDTRGPDGVVNHVVYDNMGRVTFSHTYTGVGTDFDFSDPTLQAQTEQKYDEQGRVYQTLTYPVTGGVAGTPIVSSATYNNRGMVITSTDASDVTSHATYDGLGRVLASYTSYSEGGEHIISATVNEYNANGLLYVYRGRSTDKTNDVLVEEFAYDADSGFMTSITTLNASGDEVETTFGYDDDGRQFVTTPDPDGTDPLNPLLPTRTCSTYDLLGRVIDTYTYSVDNGTETKLTHSENHYNGWGELDYTRVYKTPTSTEDFVQTSYYDWYVDGNRILTTVNADGTFSKTIYSAWGQVTGTYTGSYTNPYSGVNNDIITTQTIPYYDDAGRVWLTASFARNDSVVTAGALTTSTARVCYSFTGFDVLGRTAWTANYGAQATAPTVPASPAANSNVYIYTGYGYDDFGRNNTVTDNAGITTKTIFDNAGRTTFTVENFTSGFVPGVSTRAGLSAVQDRVTQYVYNSAGLLSQQIAVDPNSDGNASDNQVTRYFYAMDLNDDSAGSPIKDGSLLRATVYPDNTATVVDGSHNLVGTDFVETTYNYMGAVATRTDQNGTRHTYSYDDTGRLIMDAVTSFGIQPANGNLVAHWTFDETSGTSAGDSATADSVTDDATLTYNQGWQLPTWTAGVLGGGLHIGQGSYAVASTSSDLNITSQVTLSCWAKSDNPTWASYSGFVSKHEAYFIRPSASGSNNVVFEVRLSNGTWVDATSNLDASFDITKWHNYAGTYDGTTAKLYIDGVLVASRSISGTITSNSNAVNIGKEDNVWTDLEATLDDARVYNTALSATDIANLARQADIDTTVKSITYAYDDLGRQRLVTSWSNDNGSGTIRNQNEYTYDDWGRVAREYQAQSGAVNESSTPFVEYGYDSHARLHSMTYPNGRVIYYNYSTATADGTLGRLVNISKSDAEGGHETQAAADALVAYTYLGDGTVVKVSRPNGQVPNGLDLSYKIGSDPSNPYGGLDQFGRVIEQKYSNAAGTSSFWDVKYGYDADSNRLYADDQIYKGSSSYYTYDNLNRLVGYKQGQLTYSNGVPNGVNAAWTTRQQGWTLDQQGNATSVNDYGQTAWYQNTYNAANEMTSQNTRASVGKPYLVYDNFSSNTTQGNYQSISSADLFNIDDSDSNVLTVTYVSQDTFQDGSGSYQEDDYRAVILTGEAIGSNQVTIDITFATINTSVYAGVVFGYKSPNDYWMLVGILVPNSSTGIRRLYHVIDGAKNYITEETWTGLTSGCQVTLPLYPALDSLNLPSYTFPGGFPSGKVGMVVSKGAGNGGCATFRCFATLDDALNADNYGRWENSTYSIHGIDSSADELQGSSSRDAFWNPILLRNTRLKAFQATFSATRPAGSYRALNFVFDATGQDDFNYIIIPFGQNTAYALTGVTMANGQAATSVATGTTQNVPILSDSDKLWVRVECDGTYVTVKLIKDPGRALTESDWLGTGTCLNTNAFPLSGGQIGFHWGDETRVDDFRLKSYDTSTSTWKAEAVDKFDNISGYTQETPTYDNAGNQTYDGQYRYTYDAWNHMTQVARAFRVGSGPVQTGSTIATMSYDGLGRRIVKTVTNSADWDGTTVTYYNGWSDIEDRNGSGQVLRQQVWGARYVDELVQIATNANPGQDDDPNGANGTQDTCEGFYYPMQDANWNVVGLIDGTAGSATAGKLIERYTFTPCGQRTVYVSSGTNDPLCMSPATESTRVTVSGLPQSYSLCDFGHQGLLLDKEFGLIYNRERVLDPVDGRFVTRDPEGYVDVTSLYRYVRNNPVGLVDSLGNNPAMGIGVGIGIGIDLDFALAAATISAAQVAVGVATSALAIAAGEVAAYKLLVRTLGDEGTAQAMVDQAQGLMDQGWLSVDEWGRRNLIPVSGKVMCRIQEDLSQAKQQLEMAMQRAEAAKQALEAAQARLKAAQQQTPSNRPDRNGPRETTPSTDASKFRSIRGSKAKESIDTGEVWEKDMFHKDHYEVYRNRKMYDNGIRDRSVWEDGRLKEKF